MKRLALAVVARTLDPAQISLLSEEFDRADNNNNGEVGAAKYLSAVLPPWAISWGMLIYGRGTPWSHPTQRSPTQHSKHRRNLLLLLPWWLRLELTLAVFFFLPSPVWDVAKAGVPVGV